MRVNSPLLEKINTKRIFHPSQNQYGTVLIIPIIYVSQCIICFGFHGASKCEEKEVCKKCGSPDHKIKSCKTTMNCINCVKAHKGKGTYNHSPTNIECPLFTQEYEKQIKRCQNEADPKVLQELLQYANLPIIHSANNIQNQAQLSLEQQHE